MTYDPFGRGDFPVGVRTLHMKDPARDDRPLVVEVWYPADECYRGLDLDADRRDRYQVLPGFPKSSQKSVRDADPRDQEFPLILFSHGFAGHRRQSTYYTTHLASHGYVVAAVDHAGNTVTDMVAGGGAPRLVGFDAAMAERPRDLGYVLEQMVSDEMVLAGGPAVDPNRVGATGHSFGGWTTLASIAAQPAIGAAVLLAPAGAAPKLRAALDFAWPHPVPTLIVAAESDSLLPMEGIRGLCTSIPSPCRLVAIENADHMHFVDAARGVHEMFRRMPAPALSGVIKTHKPLPPFDQLCPPEHAHDVVRGLGLAHFDALVAARSEAAAWLAGDLTAILAERGVAIRVD